MVHLADFAGFKRAAAAAATLLAACAWSTAASAAQSCLLDSGQKVCLTLTAEPGPRVQPSQLGGTPTYVTFVAELQNVTLANSSRFVDLTVTLSPASLQTRDFTTSEGLTCNRSGTTMTCRADKQIEGGGKRVLEWTVAAPTTAGELTANAVFGWNGRTNGTSAVVVVADDAGATVVPPNESVTIVTEEPDPTAAVPLAAKITLPSKPYRYSATVAVISDGPALACSGGIFLSVTDGGPYVCRVDDPARWIELDIDLPLEHEDDPILYTFELKWDASIIAPAQLPPNPIAPTGTPPFAVFYAENSTPPPTSFRAFAAQCAQNGAQPPCLDSVAVEDDEDWVATGRKYSDNPNDAIAAASPLAPFYAALDFLLGTADAGVVDAPDIMR